MPKSSNNNNSELISLNKFISSTGFCSRREADKYIEQGRIFVNDEVADLGTRVSARDKVAIDGETIKIKKSHNDIFMAFNKPAGITCTTDVKDKTNIISYINYPKRIFPIGRLDKDSDGLIFLTNNGDIVNKILRAGNKHEKEYIVSVNKPITAEFIHKMSNGIPVDRKMTQNCFVRQEGKKRFRIVLTEGMNRQIRKMCEHLDYTVMSLSRVRIMNIHLGKIQLGKWRLLTHKEIEELNNLVESSSKTQEASIRPKTSRSTKRNTTSTQKKRVTSKEVTKKKMEEKSKKRGVSTPKKKTYKDYRKKR